VRPIFAVYNITGCGGVYRRNALTPSFVTLGSGPTRDDFRTTHVGLPNQTSSCKPSARPNRTYANFMAENAPILVHRGGSLRKGSVSKATGKLSDSSRPVFQLVQEQLT
jgi:hypothetical protein